MTIVDRTEQMVRFARPILWNTDDPESPYSVGGTANIVKLLDEYFILTARHCLDKEAEGLSISDCCIPWRFGDMTSDTIFCHIGEGINFTIKEDEGPFNGVHVDLCIHRLLGPSDSAPALEEGGYLELHPYMEPKINDQILLTGFPKSQQAIDDGARAIKAICTTLQGHIEATRDSYIHKFVSPDLRGLDANGMSGGLITSNFLGNLLLQGLCVQGGRNLEIDFIHFIDGNHLHSMIREAFKALKERLEGSEASG